MLKVPVVAVARARRPNAEFPNPPTSPVAATTPVMSPTFTQNTPPATPTLRMAMFAGHTPDTRR